jgi:prolyl-tRNA editing enzyme YbaK/EbsC (Cys-tRNA(Pro) deacylase)
MKDALDVHRSLLDREIPHEVVRLQRLVLTADELPEALDLPADQCVVTRVYHADDRLVAVLVRAGHHPHPAAVLEAIGARSLRSARPDVVNIHTDFAAALVCPVLLPEPMPVLADACIGHSEVVYTATGDGGTALGIPARWLLTSTGAAVAELCVDTATVIDLDAELDDVSRPARDWR